ncbi:hypothetical protein [Chryseobacterium paludis]|uniref:hypothetical protein n=1 Tax=Chryseobacterium paludis TaxID=2956784 RepID=UPI0021C1AF60|nr:hypothetical protein [Chryseobacterium paludis]
MRTFNIQKFKKNIDSREDKTAKTINKDYRMERFSYEDENAVVTLGQQSDGLYVEEVREKNSVYKMVFLYYEDTCSLAYEGLYFKDAAIGIHKTYSKDGELTEETDHDAGLKDQGILTRVDMVEVMKQKFSIDIEKEDELWLMNLYKEDEKYIWRIICNANLEKDIDFSYAYKFDAKTGEFLSKKPFAMEG